MVSYNAWCMNRYLTAGETTPVPETTTPKTKSDCCNKLNLTVDDSYYVTFLSGTYEFTGTVNNWEYWTHSGGNYGLWHSLKSGWRGSYMSGLGGASGFLFGEMTSCPTDEQEWRYYDSSAGDILDGSSGLQWECLGNQLLLMKL